MSGVPPPPQSPRQAGCGVTVQQCRALDQRATQDYGIPVLLLMEHAGIAIAHVMQKRVKQPNARIVCMAGRGHNGGDGLAAMRLLHAKGFQPIVFLLGHCATLRDEPAVYARILERVGVPVHELVNERAWTMCAEHVTQADWIVDALLGTGFSGSLKPEAQRAIELMNNARRPLLAVDAPSGVDVDTGVVPSVAVRAAVTVTFGLPKHGLLHGDGSRHAGELIVDDIAFPPALLAACASP